MNGALIDMYRILLTVIILISCLFFLSCDSKPSLYSEVFDPGSDQAVSFYLPKRTSNHLQVVEEKYIYLEDTGESFVRNVNKIVFEEDRLYILDSRRNGSIFCFDLDGQFVFKINDVGSGPDEYLEIRDFSIFEGRIYLLEAPRNQLFMYDALDGTFLGKSEMVKNYLADQFEIFEDKLYLLTRDFCKGPALTCYGLYLFDMKSGELEDKINPYSFSDANYGLNDGDYMVKTEMGIQYYYDFSNLFYEADGSDLKVFQVNPLNYPLFEGAAKLFKSDMEKYTEEVAFKENAVFFTSLYKLLKTKNLQYVRFNLGKESLHMFLDRISGIYHLLPKWIVDIENGFVNSAPVATYKDKFISTIDGDLIQSRLLEFDRRFEKAEPEQRIKLLELYGDHYSVLEPMRGNLNPLIVLTKYAIDDAAPPFKEEVITIK